MHVTPEKQIFKIKILKEKELDIKFKELDSYLYSCLALVHEHTRFVEHELLQFYIELASGKARFRNYYTKQNPSRLNMSDRMSGGYTPDDKKFLLKNYPLLHSFYTPLDPLSFHFNRFVLHSVLDKFLILTKDYCSLSEDIARGNYSLVKEKAFIEEAVKVRSPYLYGVLFQIHAIYDKFIKKRNEIIEPYLRYVFSLAKKHNSYSDEQMDENFQAGSLGLMRAVLLYNFSSTFGNYAKFWIRQSIMDNVYKSFLINIPQCSWTYFNKLEKLRDKTKTLEELSEKSGMNIRYIKDIYTRVLTSQVLTMDAISPNDYYYDPTKTELDFDEEIFNSLDEEEKFLFAVMFGKFDLLPQKQLSQKQLDDERERQR